MGGFVFRGQIAVTGKGDRVSDLAEKVAAVTRNRWLVFRKFDANQISVLLNQEWPKRQLFRIFLGFRVVRLPEVWDDFIAGKKMRNLRYEVHKAGRNGFSVTEIPQEDLVARYTEIHANRNALENLRRLPRYPVPDSRFTVIGLAVTDSEGEHVGFAYGLGIAPVMRLFVSVTTSRGEGVRFMLTTAFLKQSHEAGFRTIVTDSVYRLSANHEYYQKLWRFETVNLFTTPL
jgi:hypothetical protein